MEDEDNEDVLKCHTTEIQWWMIDQIIGMTDRVVRGSHILSRVSLYFGLNDEMVFLSHVSPVYPSVRGYSYYSSSGYSLQILDENMLTALRVRARMFAHFSMSYIEGLLYP